MLSACPFFCRPASPQAVPYPFTSREQYERTMKRAMGKEWNTAALTDAATKPQVYTRAGVIITPAVLPKDSRKKHREKRKRL